MWTWLATHTVSAENDYSLILWSFFCVWSPFGFNRADHCFPVTVWWPETAHRATRCWYLWWRQQKLKDILKVTYRHHQLSVVKYVMISKSPNCLQQCIWAKMLSLIIAKHQTHYICNILYICVAGVFAESSFKITKKLICKPSHSNNVASVCCLEFVRLLGHLDSPERPLMNHSSFITDKKYISPICLLT